jgi:hypothetical protein
MNIAKTEIITSQTIELIIAIKPIQKIMAARTNDNIIAIGAWYYGDRYYGDRYYGDTCIFTYLDITVTRAYLPI